jgi:hypothetical protein
VLAQEGGREIGQLNGNVYSARDFDQHPSPFLVTSEGVIVRDAVAAGIAAGRRSAAELREGLCLEDDANREFYEQWGPDNISGMSGRLASP